MKLFRRKKSQIGETELARLEWQADRMLLDVDEAFANSLGVYRPEPITNPMLAQNQRFAEMMANMAHSARLQHFGHLAGAMTQQQLAQQMGGQFQAQRGFLAGALGGIGRIF